MLEDVLIAWYRAPHGRSFHGFVRQRIDGDVQMRAIQQSMPEGSSFFGVSATRGATDTEVWVDADRRSRADVDGTITVADGTRRVCFVPGHGATEEAADRGVQEATSPQICWRPRRLIDALDIRSATDCEMLGRLCWQVDARPTPWRDHAMAFRLPGDHFALTVDQETGVILRADEWWHGEEVSSTEWVLFDVVDRIDDAVFDEAVPAGVTVRSQAEQAAEFARSLGVDLSGVDIGDLQQIGEAIRNRRRPRLLDAHAATGCPPDDVNRASDGIRQAFAGFNEADSDDLVNVQDGHGLVPTLERARERANQRDVAFMVGEIKFLSGEHAALLFSVMTADGHALLPETVGEAVLCEGRWRVARSTFDRLMRMAGVEPPQRH